MNLDKIKARLGSIPSSKIADLPNAVRVLLLEDLPQLLGLAEGFLKDDSVVKQEP
jgi:hypothetical protein